MKRLTKDVLGTILSLFIIFCTFIFPVQGIESKNLNEDTGIKVEAKSALLMEPISGKIIYESNAHEKYEPASVTKIMTMLLTMEAIDSGKIKFTDKVTISENAKNMGGSTMLLDTGEIRTVEELIKGVGIASGNDAAVALSEYVGGSEDAFVKMMNNRAKELGMKDTIFYNCTGLPIEGHVTTAYDISIMSRELLKHKDILKYTGIYMETLSEGRKTPVDLVNHNKLVRFFKGCDGLKTGYTRKARYCISATAVRNNVRMLAIIMGAPTWKIRNRDAAMLMNYGFGKFENKKIIEKDSDIEKVIFNKKGDKFFVAKARNDLCLTIERGTEGKVTKKCVIDKKRKSYKKGDSIGYCEIYMDDKAFGKVELYCDRDLKPGGFFNNLKSNFNKLFDNAI